MLKRHLIKSIKRCNKVGIQLGHIYSHYETGEDVLVAGYFNEFNVVVYYINQPRPFIATINGFLHKSKKAISPVNQSPNRLSLVAKFKKSVLVCDPCVIGDKIFKSVITGHSLTEGGFIFVKEIDGKTHCVVNELAINQQGYE